jgi:hypothetical protein
MAQRVTTSLIDDIDGGDADDTVRFGLDGKSYEIDLSKKNADKLRKALSSFVQAGRPTRGASTSDVSAGSRRRSLTGPDPKAVRAWAQANQISVPARGRIPATVREQFQAAGN